MEADVGGFGGRRHVMRAAEGREEVVERHFVGQIDHRESQADLVALWFEMEDVIVADAHVKQVTRSDTWRIVVVVFGTRGRYFEQRGAVARRRAEVGAKGGTDRRN